MYIYIYIYILNKNNCVINNVARVINTDVSQARYAMNYYI